MSLISHFHKNPKNIMLRAENNFFSMQCCSIWQHIISLGRMSLYYMLDQTFGDNSTSLSYNTDSIDINNPKVIRNNF